MSPKFRTEQGFTFRIFSNEEERMHVHVFHEDDECKYWLEPKIELAENYGFKSHELKKIESIIKKYGDDFKHQYTIHIRKRLNDQ